VDSRRSGRRISRTQAGPGRRLVLGDHRHAKQATKDLGSSRDADRRHDALLNRFVTQPKLRDIAAWSTSSCCILATRGVLHPIDLQEIQVVDKVVPSSPRASTPTAARSRPRASSRTKSRRDGPESTKFPPSARRSGRRDPTRLQRDNPRHPARYREGPIEPARAVKSGVQRAGPRSRRALDRHHGRRHGDRSRATSSTATSNMTKEEIDKTIKILIDAKKSGPVPGLLDDLRRVFGST